MSEAFRHSSQDVLTYFSREVNGLKDSKAEIRKNSLKALYADFTSEPVLKPYIIQELLEELLKPLLKLLSDEKEQCRETAISLLTFLVSGCTDIAGFLSYIFPVLVDRLGAYDLEGIQEVPEKMRPAPSQKPQVVLSPPEKSEEIRFLLSELIRKVLEKAEPHLLVGYLDEATSITRALVMDPASGEVIQSGCSAMLVLCTKATEKLLHYTEGLGRSLFTSLVHKHWKVRKAGLLAIQQVLYCGVYKFSYLIVEALIGFRDPNVVPIKDFYESSTKFNYLAMLANDKSAHVRAVFFSVMSNWLSKLPDRYDHESRLIPYLLTGLFDPVSEIKEDCFRYIEEIGQLYEEEKEKEIREMRQLGYQEPWTCEGLMSDLPLPDPFVKRPRLGSRLYFRQYVRRYLNAIFHELGDWISTSRLYSSNLLLSLIIFTEDYITQHLEKFLTCMCKALMINNSPEILKNLTIATRLVGRFVDTNSYMPQVLAAIRPPKSSYLCFVAVFNCFQGELQEERDQSYEGALKVMKFLLEGVCEALPPGLGISRISKILKSMISSLEKVLSTLGPSQYIYIIEILEFILVLENRAEELGDLSEIALYADNILHLCLRAEAFSNSDISVKSSKVIQSVFSIAQENSQLFFEILVEIAEDTVEKWHNYDENWKEFCIIVKKVFSLKIDEEKIIKLAMNIMHRVISSMKTSTIHAQCISLCFLPFPSGLVLNEILLPVLWNSQVSVKAKEEAFKVISQLKIFSLVLVPGLYKTLSQADMIEKALEELHNQFQASRVSESDVEKIVVDGESVCTMLVEKLTELFEDPHEDIRLLSVKIIIDLLESLEIDSLNTPKAFEVHGKPMLNKYIAPEFEIKLIGDIRILTRKLVVLLLAEVEGTFKESAHLCLTKIKEKRPLAIAHECFEAKKSGFLKRWEYLDTLLSIPNSY